jgi:hypothetical protein
MKRLSLPLFIALFIWVLLVSMIDHYYTIKLEHTILLEERNPVGLYFINLDGGSVALFMTIKMISLWGIGLILYILYKRKRAYAWAGVISLSIAQLLLVYYFFLAPALSH